VVVSIIFLLFLTPVYGRCSILRGAYFSEWVAQLNHQPGYFSGKLFEPHPSSAGDLFARCVASFGYSQDPGDAIGGPWKPTTGADDQLVNWVRFGCFQK